ncbi:MAG: tetratricopeptide repeat protein [Candidatus Latescibacterota bacterium]
MRPWIPICLLLLASPARCDLLSEGLALFEAGEYAKAHEKLSAHLAAEPESPEALFYLGKTETDGAQAQESFRMFLAKYPQHALADEALFGIAQYYYARGFYVTARQHLLRLLETYPDGDLSDRALYTLGLTFLATDEFEAARTRFEQMLADYPESGWASYARGGMVDAYFGEGQYVEAIRTADGVLMEKGNDPIKSSVLFRVSECYDKLGKKEQAAATRRRIAAECPGSYEATLTPSVPAETEKDALDPKNTVLETGSYSVQVGAFGNAANATKLARVLSEAGYDVRIDERTGEQNMLHLVRVGAYPTREEAAAASEKLCQATGLACRVVKNP